MHRVNNPVPHEKDVLLVQQARAGDREAVDQLIHRMGCISVILRRKNRRMPYPFTADELQDLAQEVFTKIWTKLDSFAGEGCLEAWTYRFCHHVMMNAQQRHVRRRQHVEESSEQENVEKADRESKREGISFGDRLALLEAVEELDGEEAEVIELKHFEGLSFSEIAIRAGISSNSAKTRYYRGLRRLEQRLGPIFREGAR